ncbi:MAG: hypothetical protein CVV47_01260 [Spirochaetae bacterium HGW-Spirochaetae-3]|jgi:hypothetical protein|nr:MAG: hypothetical protein CVV47_01260 [Spirochaetae bacterium HGW-Spirochaetae-3]
MTGKRFPILCAVAVMAAAFCHAEPAALPEEVLPGVMGPRQGAYAEAQVLIPATLATGTMARYRFSGQGTWIAFDRPLYLSAFSGEERTYAIEFLLPDRSAPAGLTYSIDLRSPEPPSFTVEQGDVGPVLRLSVDGSDDIRLSVDGAPFESVRPGEILEYFAPSDSTRIVVASAYTVDPVGNASRLTTGRWRLHPEGLVPSYPLVPYPGASAVYRDASISPTIAELTDLAGSARLTVRAPEGALPCAAVNASNPFESTAAFVELSGTQPTASCEIPFPWGYERPIVVYYGYVEGGVLHVAPEPISLKPRFTAEESPDTPTPPVTPAVVLEGSTALVDWPASPWTVMYSVGDTPFAAYEAPFRVDLGDAVTGLRYYALGPYGSRSAMGVMKLPARRAVIDPALAGVAHGASYGTAVTALPLGESRIRYSSSEGDEPPPPVSERSPSLGTAGLRFEGRPGEEVRYRLRLVAETPGADAGFDPARYSERFVSFTVDRKPPPIPEAAHGLRSYSSSDSFVSFMPQDGSIFVSVSEEGDGPFVPYEGPTAINGSDEGRRRFVIRAYAEDEFGNRSAEMKPLGLLIDRSSLYADPRGRPGASGSPDDPIPYLDDAIDAAQAAGKRFVYLRGAMPLRRTVVVTTRLAIAGGFDEGWNESGSAVAEIRASVAPSSAAYAFVVDGGELSLSSIDVYMKEEGRGGIILARTGSVSVRRSALRLSGGVEMAAIKSTGASVRLESSSIRLESTVTGRGVDVSGAALSISDSTIACDPSVRLFDAVRVNEGQADIAGLRIDASPSQSLSAISATRSRVGVARSVLFVDGGASSCRLFGASASSLLVSSVYVDVSWKGSVEAFSASSGSTVRIAHVTSVVRSPKAVFAASSGSSVELKNSIAEFYGGDSAFLRSDSAQAVGSVAANCLWGFARLVEGRSPIGAISVAAMAELNRYAGNERPNVTEAPDKTFYASVKGLMRLSPSSACVDSGVVLGWIAPVDLLGSARGAENPPDIGAEEL